MYQLGWFSTGRDKAARDLLKVVNSSIKQGELEAEIAFVFTNRERGESAESDLFLKLAENYHIPVISFSYQKFRDGKVIPSQAGALPRWRFDYDREVMNRLQGFHPDLCVLAGYMLIVGQEMCQRYNMINLHPAAPGGPKGTWQEVIWQLIGIRGKPFDKYWLDLEKLQLTSPKRYNEGNPLFKLIRKYGLSREFPLIISTLII